MTGAYATPVISGIVGAVLGGIHVGRAAIG